MCDGEGALKQGCPGFKLWPHHLLTVWTTDMTSVSLSHFTTAVGRGGSAPWGWRENCLVWGYPPTLAGTLPPTQRAWLSRLRLLWCHTL